MDLKMSQESLKLYGTIFILAILGWLFYSIYADYVQNNDPDGRRVRSNARRLFRKQKILRRLRVELKRKQTMKKLDKVQIEASTSSSTSSMDIQDGVDEIYDSPAIPCKKSRFSCDESTASETEGFVKTIEHEIELNSRKIQKSSWLKRTATKFMDFFSDEAVVPESDTDDDYPEDANASFVLIQEQDPSLASTYSCSYRKVRMNIMRQSHSWDPAF